jgi:hypothetical protein
MLSHNFVAKYRNRILNIHPAILPTFKGTHAIKDAIDYGSKVTGVTVHFVNEDMDAGPVILQEPVKINPSDTEKSLAERIHKVEHKLYPKAIRLFTKGRLKLIGRKVKIIALAVVIFFAVLNFESEAMYGNDIVTAVPLTLPIINQEIRPHITESIPVKEESPRPSLTAQYEKLGLVSYPLYDTKEPTSLKKDNNLMNAKLSIERPLTKEEIENMRIENSFKAARVVAEVMDSINAKGAYDGINGLIETAAKIIKFRNTLKTKYNLHFRIDKDEALLRYKKSF